MSDPRKIRKQDVVNRTGGVDTVDGRKLYGMDAEHYLKMQEKLDPAWELKLGKWIESVLDEKLEDPGDLYKSLKSGVVLCKLLNRIKPGTIKKFNLPKPGQDTLHPLMERENIGLYLDACWKLGVPSHNMFVTSDLHSKRYLHQVLQNIASLSRTAKTWGYQGGCIEGSGVIAPQPVSLAPQVKWTQVNTAPNLVHTEELEDDMELELKETKRQLSEANKQLRRYQYEKELLEKQINNQKSQTGGEASALKSEIISLQDELNSLNEQLRSERVVRRQSERKLTTLQDEKQQDDKLRQELDLLKQEKATDDRRLKRLRENVKELEDRLELDKKESIQLQQEKEELNDINHELTAQIEDLNRQLQRTKRVENKRVAGLKQEEESPRLQRRKTKPLISLDPALLKENDQQPEEVTKLQQLGSSVFYYEKDIDNEVLKLLNDIIDRIMKNEKLDFGSITELNELMNRDSGRRVFTYLLNQRLMTTKGNTILSADSFEFLLLLIGAALNDMHISNGADYISAKILLETSHSLYNDARGSPRFIKDYIKSHFLWQNLRFWEEYFWDTISKKYRKAIEGVTAKDAIERKQKAFIATSLKKFAKIMWGWGNLPGESVKHFVSNMADKHGLDKRLTQEVLKEVDQIAIEADNNLKKKKAPTVEVQVKKNTTNCST